MAFETDLILEATELRLGLPGTINNKRSLPDMNDNGGQYEEITPPGKTQVVGWPPIRSSRKNYLQAKKPEAEATGIYVKVSMEGAPYLRKIDLNIYKGYPELLKALEAMFKFKVGEYSEREGYNGNSEFVPTYEDKDGDWMLVGDVPWGMFITSCKRLRIMKATEARGRGRAV